MVGPGTPVLAAARLTSLATASTARLATGLATASTAGASVATATAALRLGPWRVVSVPALAQPPVRAPTSA